MLTRKHHAAAFINSHFLFLFLFLFHSLCQADQFEIANRQEAESIFWNKLYPDGGWSIFCGDKFNSEHKNVEVHAIYSIDWAAEHMACGSIAECRATSSRFNRIEADLHNLYPVKPMIATARRDYVFGTVDGEFRDFFECDFEVDGSKKVVEPRSNALGNIARAVFYMVNEYQLPISDSQLTLLRQWNQQDPPSEDEIRRNELIEKLQGTRNLYIDDPGQAKNLAN